MSTEYIDRGTSIATQANVVCSVPHEQSQMYSEVLPVFLYQNQVGHFICLQTIVTLILSLKQTHFPSHELLTALIIVDMQNNSVTKLDLLKVF